MTAPPVPAAPQPTGVPAEKVIEALRAVHRRSLGTAVDDLAWQLAQAHAVIEQQEEELQYLRSVQPQPEAAG